MANPQVGEEVLTHRRGFEVFRCVVHVSPSAVLLPAALPFSLFFFQLCGDLPGGVPTRHVGLSSHCFLVNVWLT